MVKHTSNKIGLGLFVTIAIILFTIGIYFVGQRQQIFRKTFHLGAVFKNVNGLQPGNNVWLLGINVGIVNSITQTTDTSVRVDMQIDERSRGFIRKDAKASIGSDGLIGNKIVSIAPGTSGNGVKNNDVIATISPADMGDVMLKLKATGDTAYSMVSDLAAIAKNVRNGKGTVGMLFEDSVFAGNLKSSLVNIRQGTQGFKQNMDAASHSIFLRGYLKKKEKEKEKDSNKQKQ